MRPLELSRGDVLALRYDAQGLHRAAAEITDLAVLDIGVQDSGPDAAKLAFDARLTTAPPAHNVGPQQPLALVWGLRGAPYLHRRSELDDIAAASWPLSDADAATRLGETGARLKKAGRPALEGFAEGVELLRTVITEPTAKGAASTAISGRMSEELGRFCRVCQVVHVSELIMRLASTPAGIELEPDTSPPVLLPNAGFGAAAGDVLATQRLARRYLALLGPATAADVAGYLGARRADIEGCWPDDLRPTLTDGKAGWLPAETAARLESGKKSAPPPPRGLRLIGAFDPWLQARDRELIVPDQRLHKALWPVLGRPGVILGDGEVIGTWRPQSKKLALQLRIEEFVPFSPSLRRDLDVEANRVATVRGQQLTGLQLSS
ncbi:Winged helix DNA-binding domain-containing protein [Frankineae bacterium MT45]|nr:Winged helix DNA-binding domain-containing protein [Frankineae bacterium MT45]